MSRNGWFDRKRHIDGLQRRDIHPQATLSRIYFENMFCLSAVCSADGKTDVGVRVALGDSSMSHT